MKSGLLIGCLFLTLQGTINVKWNSSVNMNVTVNVTIFTYLKISSHELTLTEHDVSKIGEDPVITAKLSDIEIEQLNISLMWDGKLC